MTKLAAFEHGAVIARVLSPLLAELWTTLLQVKTPKYNCPVDLYSETTMDEMVGGSMPEWVSSWSIIARYQIFLPQRGETWPQWARVQEMEGEQEVWPEQERGAGCDAGPGGGTQAPLIRGHRVYWHWHYPRGWQNVLYFWMNRMMIDNTRALESNYWFVTLRLRL